ncbi:ZNF596 [Branchiostoma lanceolatum]|uniref:ZNF596 protein n=1 Tax=Branchiostoma lanceolatum TaxID=7740 RepID=A0A8K0E9M7_BRALA|nr:ZNF596 [Branchiostoma lanceolatum]
MHPRISLADVRKGYRERDQSSTCLRAGTDAMSRRKQPNPKPLKVEEDLLSDDDDDDDDELVIFEDSSDGDGDTQLKDDLDGDYVGFDTAQGSEEERVDKEAVLEGSSTYKRLRPKRKCTRNIPTDDGDDDTAWKKSRTEETETHQLFACPTCSKGFKAQNEIQIHMRKHTGEKPFSCPFCHKAYPRRKTMYRHIREQHTEQWQRGRFPGRRYRAAINRAMKDSMRQWKLLRSTSSPGAAAGTEGSVVTGAEDQSKVLQLAGKQETTSPPTTPSKKSPFGTLCGKYKKIAPAPLKPALAVVRQMPVSTPSGVHQQFFLVNSQSGVAVPINLTNTATDPAATNASTSSPTVAMPTNPQTFVQTTLSPVAMPTNPQTIVQASSSPVPVAMATHPHTVIQASSLPVPVAMPTNPQIVVQNSLSSVAMPTNPQTVVQTSSPCVAMPTNPQAVVQTNFSPVPVAMPTNPQTVLQTSLPPVAMAANPQMVLQTSSSPVVMPTDGLASFTQPMSLPSSLPLLNQPSQVSTATVAMATIITPPSPVFQQVVMPTFVPVQYQTPQVPMVAVSKATHLSQTAPVGQQAIMPKLFQAQNQGPILPLPAQRFSNVAMTASPPSQIAMATTTPANPAVPSVVMPTLLPVQNQPAQVAVTTASQASLPNPTLSQVAMTKASSTKPVRILPVMTPTARTPTPIAPVIQEVAMPTCSPLQTQQPQQVSKFRPILPRTLENCLFYDSLKDDRGQYKPLTADILERNNTCSLCGSMLRSLRYLIMHLFKFHQHYKCRLCAPRLSEFFASEQLLKSHLLQTHWPVHSVPNEDAARRLHYHFKRSCQAVEAVRAIGNPLEVSEITSSDICFKNGKALKYRVNYNILTPGRFMNDGDITVKRTSTNTLSITCIFFHTSSVLKGGNAQKADLASNSKGTTPSSADGTSVKRRTAPPPNVADLLKRFKAVSSTQKEGGPGMQTDVLSTSPRASGPSPHTAAASLSSPQSSSSSPHPTMSAGSNQSGKEHPKNPTDALECHRCDICGQVFAELQELQQHMNVHIELKPFKCNLCSRLFPHAATLEAHVKAHYKGEIEDEPTTIPANVKISFCKEARKSESTSEKRNSDSVEKEAVDSATADSEEDDPSDDGACNVCRLCGKTYTNSASLIRHLRTHQEGFKLSCPICGKGFNLSYHLKEHMNVHTKNKPYKCHICGKSFTHSGTLSAHLKCHKSREGIVAEYSSFSCRYCSVQFTHIKKYLDHLKVRHGVFDFDFEEAEKDIILCNASREANASQSCLVEAVDTAKESETDKSEDVPATEAGVTTVAASATQDNIQASSSSHTPASEQPESKTSGQAIRYPTGKTVAELIGLRKTKPAETESFTNTSQSSGEPSPIVITQAISLRPFVDKIMAASTSTPDKAHGETPSVTKFKPILPKAYIRVQPFTSFQVAPGTTSTMEAAASNEGLDSANNKNMNEFRWKMKDSDPVQPVLVPDAEMAMYTSKQYQMTRVDPCPWYKCRKCGVGYTSILHLKHHICGACSKYMMKCEDCDLTFCSFKRLENHLTKEHLEEYNEDQQLSEESDGEGDDVRMDSAEEQREQERQERRSSTQEKANHEYGQVVVKVEQIEDGSMEPTNYSATIKQEELEGQKWWFEGDNDLEGNKMMDGEVKEEDAKR